MTRTLADVPDLLRERAEFKIASMSAEGHGNGDRGDLPDGWRDLFDEHAFAGRVTYVVRSFKLPIMWVVDGEQIIMPPVRYSITTTSHQQIVSEALERGRFESTSRAVPQGIYGRGWQTKVYG
jgi:hypothetical protein